MSIRRAISRAFLKRRQREWDKTYWAIDLHDTIIESTHKLNLDVWTPYYGAMAALRKLSEKGDHVLILFTSTHEKRIEKINEWFCSNDITFKYINENPECNSTDLCDFSAKFYYDILVDDKAGFDPHSEWFDVYGMVSNNLSEYTNIETCARKDLDWCHTGKRWRNCSMDWCYTGKRWRNC